MTSETTPPSVEEIEQMLKPSNSLYAAMMLRRIYDGLKSGAYALVSREDRIAALERAQYAGRIAIREGFSDAAATIESHRLLHLDPPAGGGQ